MIPLHYSHINHTSDTCIGVDLSPKMVQHARARGCYTSLAVEELVAYLQVGGI